MGKRKYVSLTEQMVTESERLVARYESGEPTASDWNHEDYQLLKAYLRGDFSRMASGPAETWKAIAAEAWKALDAVEATLTKLSGWEWNPQLLTPEAIARQARKMGKELSKQL